MNKDRQKVVQFDRSVVFVFLHDILQTAAARITKLDTEMFHHESRKRNYFGVRWSKVKVTRHKNYRRWYLHSCECRLFMVYGCVTVCLSLLSKQN